MPEPLVALRLSGRGEWEKSDQTLSSPSRSQRKEAWEMGLPAPGTCTLHDLVKVCPHPSGGGGGGGHCLFEDLGAHALQDYTTFAFRECPALRLI